MRVDAPQVGLQQHIGSELNIGSGATHGSENIAHKTVERLF
jgi:hypothetical protein